jgi:hypothetical protein
MSNDRLTFLGCVLRSLDNDELVAHFDRLTGRNVGRKGSPLDLVIDDATGRQADDLDAFIGFVRDVVWDRLPAEARAEAGE